MTRIIIWAVALLALGSAAPPSRKPPPPNSGDDSFRIACRATRRRNFQLHYSFNPRPIV